MNKGKVNRYFLYIIELVFAGLILVIMTYRLREFKNMYVVPDEFGYWTAASFFFGNDWASVASYNPYYSFGYGILLMPLFFIRNPEIRYQSAIILNAVLLSGSFFMLSRCFSLILKEKKIWCIILAFCTTLYASNIALSHTTMCENLLVFLFSCICFFLIKVIYDEKKCLYVLLLSGALCFLYWTHLRTVAVLSSAALCIFLMFARKVISKKQIVLFGIVLFLGILCGHAIKDLLINTMYTNSTTLAVNDYSGQTSKILTLFSFQGIIKFFFSFLGKVWYLGASTVLFFYLGLAQMLTIILTDIKVKKCTSKAIFCAFLFFCVLLVISVSSLYMISGTRIDSLIYGRYNEFIISPIIGLGIYYLYSTKSKYKDKVIIIGIHFILSILVNAKLENGYSGIVYTNIIGIYKWIVSQGSNIAKASFYSSVIFIIILLLSICFQIIKKRWSELTLFCSCLILIVTWGQHAIAYLEEENIYFQQLNTTEEIGRLVNEVQIDNDFPIYYIGYADDTYTYNRIFLLQYLLSDTPITCIQLQDLQESDYDNGYFITNRDSNAKEFLDDQYEMIFESNYFLVYMCPDSYEIDIAKEYISELEHHIQIVQDDFKYNDGILYESSDMSLPRANYTAVFSIHNVLGRGTLGYCKISAANGEKAIASYELTEDMFFDGKAKIEIPFSLYEATSDVVFSIYAYNGTEIEIEDAYYYQRINEYTLGLDNPEEMTKMVDDIQNYDLAYSGTYINSSEDEIDVSYLNALLKDSNIEFSVSSIDDIEFLSRFQNMYVIADKGYLDWINLLPDYTVLEQYENHILLASTKSISKDIDTLSTDNFANLSLIEKKISNTYVSKTYDLKDGGEFEIKLTLSSTNYNNDNVCIQVFSGDHVIDEFEVSVFENTVSVPIQSDSAISNLSFRIYSSQTKEEILYVGGEFAQLKDRVSYIYDRELKPLLDLADEIVNKQNTVTMVTKKWSEFDKESILKYLEGEVEFFDYGESDEIKESKEGGLDSATVLCTQMDWFISSIDAEIIYDVLPEYTIIERTNWYTLLVKSDILDLKETGISALSNGREIYQGFFENIDEDGITKWKISLPGGTFEIEYDIQLLNQKQADNNTIQVQIWNGQDLFDTSKLETETGKIVISSQNGLSDIHFEILETNPGSVNVDLKGIRKLSDSYNIKLSEMRSYSGRYDEKTKSITTSADTIYGPYTTLKKGKYKIAFLYQSNYPDQIFFDIAVNGGVTLADSSSKDVEITSDGYQVTIPITAEEDFEQVEFRVYVPEGTVCTLQSIEVVPVE